jgi:hypothetical protein
MQHTILPHCCVSSSMEVLGAGEGVQEDEAGHGGLEVLASCVRGNLGTGSTAQCLAVQSSAV